LNGNASIGSTVTLSPTAAAQQEAALILLSQNAALMPPQFTYPGINLRDQNSQIVAGSGVTVININGDLDMSSHAQLTLSAPSTANLIINVMGEFHMSGQSSIVLSGGISSERVLFNIVGAGADVSLSGGALLNGTILATERSAQVSGNATIY